MLGQGAHNVGFLGKSNKIKKVRMIICLAVVCLMGVANFASADMFGTGDNAFNIDFVPISGSTNPTRGIAAGDYFTFTGVANDYRMGTYEVSNDQWTKFKAAYGVVTGSPSNAYDQSPFFGTNAPTNRVSWYEAAQFVNWLNTSTGNQVAYKFTGTQGTSNYTLATWSVAEASIGTNLYRNKDAKYFLPTENEWVKAAYWNGTSLQNCATKAGQSLTQGNGINGTGWNYETTQYATNPAGPWNVGSGSQELNGTYDMMGNVSEWMENIYSSEWSGGIHCVRGGMYGSTSTDLTSSSRFGSYPYDENFTVGFRVASIPEPATLLLFGLGRLVLRRRHRG